MATKKKLLQAAAGQAGGAGLNIEDVFSTYLYTGDSTSPRTITNGIDLSGEGGMVWFKSRTTTTFHGLFDTERGATLRVRSDSGAAQDTLASDLTAFNSDGFTLGNGATTNTSPRDYCSWTFRKAPKFFTCLTYTGDGTTGRQISHDLDHTVGCMILKETSGSGYWGVYHRSTDSTAPEDYVLLLNSTSAKIDEQFFINDTAPTSTHFTVGASAASGGDFNTNGDTYVAYLFAHNDGDADFGSTADQDIIKCGSYTGNGSTTGPSINLGFEPQWLLIKKATASGTNRSWWLADSMRGFVSGSGDEFLQPNSSAAESGPWDFVNPTATGFQLSTTDDNFNTNNIDYIYIAIRRGPMAVPTAATDVFDVTLNPTSPNVPSDTLVDSLFFKSTGSVQSWWVADRLRQGAGNLQTDTTAAETSNTYLDFRFDQMTGTRTVANSFGSNYVGYTWKRAPNYFDVVAYTGTGSAMTLNHNLGVTPEMIWTKRRDSIGSWIVYHSATGLNKYLFLNSTAAVGSAGNYYAVSDTTFGAPFVNSGGTFISYLFASLDGVSKVGSVTIQSGSTTVDCGFSGGPRFVLLKRTDGTSSWNLFDSERGIVAGNDPYLNLNQTAAEITGNDLIDPTSSGFTLTNLWTAGQTWIYYAIA